MKIIYNRFIPFRPFWATNLCGFVFVRKDVGRLTEEASNHEYIHSLQQREMGYVLFFLWYNIEWLMRLVFYRNSMKAYRNIAFEREAYANERNLNYAKQRRHFAWCKYYRTKSGLRSEIREFYGEIRDFIREDFRPLKYLFFLLAAAGLLTAQIHYHFYDWAMKPSYADGTSMLTISGIYAAVYYVSLLVTLALHRELWRLRQWQVWVFPLILVGIQGAGQGFHTYTNWIHEAALTIPEVNYLTITGSFLFRSVAIVGLLCVFRWATTGHFGLYGLVRSTKFLKVYGLIFLALIPVFVAVSFTPQFLEFYPKMSITYCQGAFNMADASLIGLFELCYANDFLGVESMFRGALVIGMTRWLGPRAVIPMALTYMSIHFGKPDLEMCSSVIGGYLLGILAYRTKHLWGGITIHLGIAMTFEFLGLLRIYLG
ncbi:MAG: CPBP family intramembrane metalloprotease [Bacteroidales bacterium]|nr:CPBP family intramembrane metalloprotease [Bacteroidales bacterium]